MKIKKKQQIKLGGLDGGVTVTFINQLAYSNH